MRELEWIGKEIDERKEPDYEQAYAKAALEGFANGDSFIAYETMYGLPPKLGTPYWLVRLAIYYGALSIGHKRAKRKMNSSDEKMWAAVKRLNENELRNNKDLWHRLYLHDLEDVKFCGAELVS